MKRAAELIVAQHGGQLPSSSEALKSLPGIGEYTAAAVASICFGEAVPVVDGNVLRVVARFRGMADDIAREATRRQVAGYLRARIPPRRAGDFNEALMETGALVCRPRAPECGRCPLSGECVAFREDRTGELPVKTRGKPVPHYEIAVGIVTHKGRILLARRRADQMLGGLWEFPGGKRAKGESLRETVAREVGEETAVRVEVGDRLCTVKHAYSHFRITLHAFRCRFLSGRPRPLSGDEVRWVPETEVGRYPFPRANLMVLEALAGTRRAPLKRA
jgi:A/G-specific adenine glycosylase